MFDRGEGILTFRAGNIFRCSIFALLILLLFAVPGFSSFSVDDVDCMGFDYSGSIPAECGGWGGFYPYNHCVTGEAYKLIGDNEDYGSPGDVHPGGDVIALNYHPTDSTAYFSGSHSAYPGQYKILKCNFVWGDLATYPTYYVVGIVGGVTIDFNPNFSISDMDLNDRIGFSNVSGSGTVTCDGYDLTANMTWTIVQNGHSLNVGSGGSTNFSLPVVFDDGASMVSGTYTIIVTITLGGVTRTETISGHWTAPTDTPTNTPTYTNTPTSTDTPTVTNSFTETYTPSNTNTAPPTDTPPTSTATHYDGRTYTYTPTPTPPTNTPTPTATQSDPWSDPVDPFTGGIRDDITDIYLMGRNRMDFQFKRIYRGDMSWYTGPLGRTWTHNYNSFIMKYANNDLYFTNTDGQQFVIKYDNGSYIPPVVMDFDITINGSYLTVHKDSEKRDYVYEFDAEGTFALLTEIRNQNNEVIYLTYGSNHMLESVIDTVGREIFFVYNQEGRIQSITYGVQNTLNYQYDQDGNLISVTGARVDCHYEYTNDTEKKLTYKNENRSGRGYEWVRYYYDSNGKVSRTQAPEGIMDFIYEMYDDLTDSYITFAPTEVPTRTEQEIIGTINSDDPPFRTRITDYDGKTVHLYFAANGFQQKFVKDGVTKEEVEANTSNIRPATVTDENGAEVSYVYDSNNRVYQKVQKMTLTYGGSAQNAVTTYTYDVNGFVASIIDPRGNKVEFLRDTAGNITHKRYYEGTSTLISTVEYIHFSTSHKQARTKINNGNIVVRDYSWNYANENAITYTETVNGVLYKETTYDRYGRTIAVENSAGTEYRIYNDMPDGSYMLHIDKPGRNDTTQYFDRRGNMYRSVDANGKETLYSYTANELKQNVSSGTVTKSNSYIPYGQENAHKLQSTSDNLKTTIYDYYADGRLESLDFDGIETNYAYSVSGGIQEKTVTDDEGKVVKHTYNELGLLLRTYYQTDGSEVRYEYDLSGNRVKLIQEKSSESNTYEYDFDAMNRVESIEYDNESAITFTYDESGNVITRSNAGLMVVNIYDDHNRIIRVDENGQVKQRMEYADTCASCCSGNKKLKSEEIDGYGKIQYTYSQEGWLETTLYSPYNEPSTLIQNQYDNTGHLTKVTLDGSVITEYGYDNVNHWMNKIYDKTDSVTGEYDISYDAVGHKTDILYPNSTKMNYEYGQGYKIDKANGVVIGANESEELITKNEILLRDNIGNIKQKAVNTGTQSYTYDDLYQLTGYTGDGVKNISYTYDFAGNRTAMSVQGEQSVSYTIGDNNKTTGMTIVSLENISYDGRGNMTAKHGTTYSYDFKDRLAGIPSENITYTYNTQDRKIRKIKNGKPVFYFYNGDKLLCEKFSQSRNSKIYINDNEGLLGMKRYAYDKDNDQYQNTQKIYYLFDELGSVTALTNEKGKPIKYYLYDPFGNVVNTDNDPGNNFTFVGRYGGYKDWDSGFINFWHRWYDSELGKWITRDPIGERGGVNLYRYVSNNSLNIIDVLGFDEKGNNPPGPSDFEDTCIYKVGSCIRHEIGTTIVSISQGTAECMIGSILTCLLVAEFGPVVYSACVLAAYDFCTTLSGGQVPIEVYNLANRISNNCTKEKLCD